MNSTYLLAAAAALLALGLNAQPARGALPALAAPQIFAPGVISGSANDGSPTFSPDGKTLLFTRSGTSWGVILESHLTGDTWSRPQIAAFSGQWNDWAPEFSPDGSYLVFVSIRDHRANLWRVDRTASGWGTPVRLPDTVNIGKSIWKPSMAANGSIYFVSIDDKGGKRLYRSHFAKGAYEPAQPLSFSDGTTGDVDAEVAPDESFMLFASSGRIAGNAKDHLFVVFAKNGQWQTPEPIHFEGDVGSGSNTDDEPHFSPDRRPFYFSSDRSPAPTHFPRSLEQARADLDRVESWDNSNANVWFVPLAPILDAAPAN